MNIWIDLDNTPHVPFVLPIIDKYEELGHTVVITSRAVGQIQSLLKISEVKHFCIGGQFGKNKIIKIVGTFLRSWALIKYLKNSKIDLTNSHGSRSQAIAAKYLKIPSFIEFDYEFTETKIFNYFSTRIWVPELIPDSKLSEIGIKKCKIIKYPGLKEELYVSDFVPDLDFPLANNLPADKIIVILKPPGTTANYHDSKSERLLENVIKLLVFRDDIFTICLPRNNSQAKTLSDYQDPIRFIVADRTYSELDLLWNADLVISGGGTMIREALLLGVPSYSIFSGRQGSVDSQLEKNGRLDIIRKIEDLDKIKLNKRESKSLIGLNNGDDNCLFIVNESLKIAAFKHK